MKISTILDSFEVALSLPVRDTRIKGMLFTPIKMAVMFLHCITKTAFYKCAAFKNIYSFG